MSKKPERKGLGRGLSALLADTGVSSDVASQEATKKGLLTLPIEKVRPNPDQPRRDFADQDLADLAASVAEKGVIQPLIVRIDPGDKGMYQIIAGERRWRAAQHAKLHELPAILCEADDSEVLQLAIIENIQRADLNAIEEAAGYRQLMDRFGHTQDRLASELGKSRSHIANLLRLLSLPDQVIDLVRKGRLTAGHARALVTSDDPVGMAQIVVSKGLSVRETERLVKQGLLKSKQKQILKPKKDADTRAIEADLSAALGMRVSIDTKPGQEAGELRIRYRDLDQLDTLLRHLSQ